MLLRWVRCHSAHGYITCSHRCLWMEAPSIQMATWQLWGLGQLLLWVLESGAIQEDRTVVVSLTMVIFHTSCDSHPAVV